MKRIFLRQNIFFDKNWSRHVKMFCFSMFKLEFKCENVFYLSVELILVNISTKRFFLSIVENKSRKLLGRYPLAHRSQPFVYRDP